MSRSLFLFLPCTAIIVLIILAVPTGADTGTQTTITTSTPTQTTVIPTTTATTTTTTATPTQTTVIPTTTATTTTTTTTPTQTTVIPTTTVTTVPVTTVTTTAVTSTTTVVTTTTTTPGVPVAGFSESVVSGTAPLTVQFADSSTNSPTAWNWNFGDGNTSTAESPSYTYADAGTYSVSLTASNSAGSNTETQTDLITVNEATTAPVADFTQSISAGATPLTVEFTDDSTNSPTSWSWSFGDGNTSTVENPSYTYTSPGIYTVALTASNAGGSNTTTVESDVTAVAGTGIAPVASFTESDTTGTAPLTVQFSDESENAPTSWVWNFGDGDSGNSENPSHTYTESGDFAVSLTATNSAGSNISAQQDVIRVSAAPVAAATYVPTASATAEPAPPEVSFDGEPTSGPAPLVVTFTPSAPGSPESYAWDFGDGGTSTEREPTYTYTTAGSYTVTLTVKYAAGSRPSVRQSYIVVTGSSSTGSPLSPAAPILALGIAGAVLIITRPRGRQ